MQQIKGGQVFCYRFIRLHSQAYIGFVLFVLITLILLYAIKQFKKAERIHMVSKNIRFIYIAIFAWAASYLIKLIAAQILYWSFLGKENQKQYSAYSKYLFCIDLTGVFLVQAVLILVVYNWMNNIVNIFKQISQMQDSSQQKKRQSKNYFIFEQVSQTILRLYLIARFIFFGILITFLILRDQYSQCILVKITLALLESQAFCVIIIMIFGILAIKRNQKLAELVNQQEISLIFKKYIVLLACAAVRFGVDTSFLWYYFSDCLRQKSCKIDDLQQNWKRFFAHALPVLVVLRIYRVQQKNVDLTESLLAAQQYNSSASDDMITKDK